MTYTDDLTPEQRRAEIAEILAAGFLRLCRRCQKVVVQDGQDSGIDSLDVPARTGLSGHNVLQPSRPK